MNQISEPVLGQFSKTLSVGWWQKAMAIVIALTIPSTVPSLQYCGEGQSDNRLHKMSEIWQFPDLKSYLNLVNKTLKYKEDTF